MVPYNRLRILKRSQERLLVKYSPVAGKIPAFGRSQYHVTTTKDSSSLGVDLALILRNKLYVLQRIEPEKWSRPLGTQRIMSASQMSGTEFLHC